MATTVGDRDLVAEFGFERALGNNGALTMPANLAGNPAVSLPVGTVDGLPVGMQIIGRHHQEQLLLDLARGGRARGPGPGGPRRAALTGQAGSSVLAAVSSGTRLQIQADGRTAARPRSTMFSL